VRPYLEKPFTKEGLVEWLKVKALSSSPSTEKKKKKKTHYRAGVGTQ
jgi:ribosomal protein S21